jgi:hypothetical protein
MSFPYDWAILISEYQRGHPTVKPAASYQTTEAASCEPRYLVELHILEIATATLEILCYNETALRCGNFV